MFVFTSFAACQIVCFLKKIRILSMRLKAFRTKSFSQFTALGQRLVAFDVGWNS